MGQREPYLVGLGQHIRELRAEAGTTQRDLATAVGCDHTYISKIETGAIALPPAAELLRAVGRVLNTDPEELVAMARQHSKAELSAEIARLREENECLRQRLAAW